MDGMWDRMGLVARGGRRRLARLGVVILLAVLTACGSPEEKEAEHLERAIAHYEDGSNAKAMVELRNVLRLDPKNAKAIYYVGLIHERAQRWPQAFAAYQAAAAEQPDMIEAHLKIGTLGLLGNDLEAVRTAAAAIEKVAPGHPDALALEGALELRQGDPGRALELASQALDRDSGNINAVAVKVGALQKMERLPEALAAADAAIADHPADAGLRLLKISLLEASGDKAAVQAAYDELIAIDPENEDYRLALANFLQSRNDPAGAQQVLQQAVSGDYATARSMQSLVRLVSQTQGAAAAEALLRKRIEERPQDYPLRFLLAELSLQQQQPDSAIRELQAIVDQAPAEGVVEDAKAAMAQVALAGGDAETARRLVDEVLAQNGEHRGANLIRGLLALQQGRPDEAIRYGRTALRRDPGWAPALKLVAEAHLRSGDRDLAINALNEVLAGNPGDVAAAQTLANLLTERGDYDAALKIWNLVLQQDAGAEQALRSRAQIAIRQQNWAAAQADIDTLLKTPDGQAAGAMLAGNLMLARNEFEEGRQWFEKARAMAPQAPEPVIGMVRTYLAQDDTQGAVAYLQAHTAAHPEDAVAFNMMGELALRGGDAAAAEAAFTQAIGLQPQWVTPRRQLARLRIEDGRLADAAATYEAALQAIPDNVELLSELGSLRILQGEAQQAIEVYGRILKIAPDSEVAVNNLAALVADHAFEDEAALGRALELASRFRTSTNPLYLDTLGWLYYRKGDYPVAATYLERAVNLAVDRPDLRYHLGMALARSGQKERARQELARATAEGVEPYAGIEEARATLAAIQAELQQPRSQEGTAAGTSG